MMKGKDVSAFGKFHDNGIFKSVRAIKLGELGAQAAGLDANHGVELRVKISRTPKDFGGDLEFLDGGAGVIDGVPRQIAKQFAKGLRAMQSVAAYEPVNLLEKMLPVCHKGP
jgi:hypothetical protein